MPRPLHTKVDRISLAAIRGECRAGRSAYLVKIAFAAADEVFRHILAHPLASLRPEPRVFTLVRTFIANLKVMVPSVGLPNRVVFVIIKRGTGVQVTFESDEVAHPTHQDRLFYGSIYEWKTGVLTWTWYYPTQHTSHDDAPRKWSLASRLYCRSARPEG